MNKEIEGEGNRGGDSSTLRSRIQLGPLEEPRSQRCAVCGKEAEKQCGSCHTVHYCGLQHQKEDWKQHRKVCLPFLVKYSGELGRYLIASRDLDERCLVIREAPFAFAPYDQTENENQQVPMCLSCCVRMSHAPGRRCSSCKWPLCSQACEEMSTHTHYECRVLTDKKIAFPPPQPDATYSSILILRLLLQRDKYPRLWSSFLAMEHHNASREGKERCNNDDMLILENLREYLQRPAPASSFSSSSPQLPSINETEIRQVIGRVSVNSFGVTRREERKHDETVGRGVYLKTGIVAHGCIPNAVWGISYSPHFEIVVRTAVRIKKGEIITPTYSDIWNSLGTYQRLTTMQERSHFVCKCRRCSDPTELGTFLSAILCPKCQQGHLLPLQPTDLANGATWKCRGCGREECQRDLMDLVEDMEYTVDQLISIHGQHNNNNHPNYPDIKKSTLVLDEELRKLSGVVLHPNHFIVRNLQRAIMTNLYPVLKDCTFDEIRRFISHAEQLLKVSDILTPGYTGHGGILRNYLCVGLMELKTKAVKEDCVSTIFKSNKVLSEHVRRIEKLKAEAAAHLHNDPDSNPEILRRDDVPKQNKVV